MISALLGSRAQESRPCLGLERVLAEAESRLFYTIVVHLAKECLLETPLELSEGGFDRATSGSLGGSR